MKKMDPRVKDLWIAALTSGKYRQGIGYLKRGRSFCCLGVLCDLHAKETGGAWTKGESGKCSIAAYDGANCSLPPNVRKWAGLSDRGTDKRRFAGQSFVTLNDKVKLSFKQIAMLLKGM